MTDWSQSEIDDFREGSQNSARELERLNSKKDQSLANDKAFFGGLQKSLAATRHFIHRN